MRAGRFTRVGQLMLKGFRAPRKPTAKPERVACIACGLTIKKSLATEFAGVPGSWVCNSKVVCNETIRLSKMLDKLGY